MSDTSHRGRNLRGASFTNMELQGADFGEADVRGVDFSGADLSGADFSDARLGVGPGLAASLFAMALVVVAGAGWVTGLTLADIFDELRSSEWERVLGGTLAVLVIVVFVVSVVVAGLRSALFVIAIVIGATLALNYIVLAIRSGDFDIARDGRVIALVLLLGASMVAGGLSRVLGGTYGQAAIVLVAVTGGFAAGRAGGGLAGLVVSMLLVVLAKRTLGRDRRDRFAHDLVLRVVSRRGTRFVDTNLAEADFTGTRIRYCDTTGATLDGAILDDAVGEDQCYDA